MAESMTQGARSLASKLELLRGMMTRALERCRDRPERIDEVTFPFGLGGATIPLSFYPDYDPRYAPPSYRLTPNSGGG